VSEAGTYSYGLAAAAYFALSLMLMTRWRRQFHGSLLLPASLVSAMWSAALAWQSTGMGIPLAGLFLMLEVVRDTLWLAVLMRVIGGVSGREIPRWAHTGVYAVAALVMLAALMAGVLDDLDIEIDLSGTVLVPGVLLLALIGLFLVEQVYRNTRSSQEWSVKFFWIAAGTLFVYDLCLYSITLLFREIPLGVWEARGAANAIAVPLLAVGVARTAQWSPQVFMSRRPVLYTTSFIGAGLYLLAISVVGYYIRIFGGSWGGAAQILFIFGAALLLVIVLFSGQARAWIRVFLTKHFYPYKYDYRVEWLRMIRTLSASVDTSLAQRTITALAQIVNSNAGGIWVATDEGRFVPSGGDLAGPDSPSEPADSPFLAFIAAREWIVDLNAQRRLAGAESAAGEGRAGGLAVSQKEERAPEWLLRLDRAWLVIPLLQEDRLVAFVAVAQSLAPQDLAWEDLDLLRTVGRQVAGYIALDLAARKLAQSQQFEAYNRFAAFMMHDLKNLVAQQTLVVQNAARHRDKPEFIEDAITTIDNSVRRMNRLLEQLRRGDTMGVARRVRLGDVCAETVRRCADRRPAPQFTAKDDAEVLVSAERLALVLGHVIRNAQDATSPEGRVDVELRREGHNAVIEVRDTGTGMDPAFVRDRLFRPFDTTKGSQGMGIGAFQTREFVRMSGGDVAVHSTPGKGTRFVITLPGDSHPRKFAADGDTSAGPDMEKNSQKSERVGT
jgi:putative PEP-CTERM system histidine kinase